MTSTGMSAQGNIPIINTHYPDHDSTEELAAAPTGAARLSFVTTSYYLIHLDRSQDSEETGKIGFVRAELSSWRRILTAILAGLGPFSRFARAAAIMPIWQVASFARFRHAERSDRPRRLSMIDSV